MCQTLCQVLGLGVSKTQDPGPHRVLVLVRASRKAIRGDDVAVLGRGWEGKAFLRGN